MIRTCFLLLAGAMAAQHTTQLLSADVLDLLLLVSLCGLASQLLRWPATLCLGFVLLQLAGADVIGKRLDPAYAGDSMLATVQVDDFPRRAGEAVVMSLVPIADARLPPRMRVSWYQPPAMPRIGEVWELEIRLRPPRGRLLAVASKMHLDESSAPCLIGSATQKDTRWHRGK